MEETTKRKRSRVVSRENIRLVGPDKPQLNHRIDGATIPRADGDGVVFTYPGQSTC